jgi:RNA polymerase sigma-70 factor (ECF subfamily)
VLTQQRGRAEVEGQVADLVAAHRRELLDLCQRRLGGDRHLAEDVVQETFLKLGRALASGQEIQNPRGWLRTVASHGTVDELRRRGPMLLVEPPDAVGLADVDLGGVSAELDAAWRGLAPRHREVLRLRELEGLHYDEIATAMATRVSAVETLLFRARTALRREYSRAAANVATAQAQLAVAPLAGRGGGDGWLNRVSERLAGPSAAGRFESLIDSLRLHVAELVATVALGTAALGGALAPAPAPAAAPIAVPDVPAIPTPAAPEVDIVGSVPTVPEVRTVDVPAVPSVPAAPDVDVEQTERPESPAAAPTIVDVVEVVGEVIDDVTGDDGLVGEIVGSTARNREPATSDS